MTDETNIKAKIAERGMADIEQQVAKMKNKKQSPETKTENKLSRSEAIKAGWAKRKANKKAKEEKANAAFTKIVGDKVAEDSQVARKISDTAPDLETENKKLKELIAQISITDQIHSEACIKLGQEIASLKIQLAISEAKNEIKKAE